MVIIGYATLGFLFAILLIVLFAGGSLLPWVFPLRGLDLRQFRRARLAAENPRLFLAHRLADHLVWRLGAFATTTLLVKNSFLDEIRKQYVLTARIKGLGRAPRALPAMFSAMPC